VNALGALAVAAVFVGSPQREPGVLERYLDALHAGAYARAFADLAPDARAYFGSVAHFASTFQVDAYRLERWSIVARRAGAADVDEAVAFDDPLRAVRVRTTVRVRYALEASGVRDVARPRRAYAPGTSSVRDALRVTLARIACDAHTTRIVLVVQNDGTRAVTILPYGRSVLRVDGTVTPPLATRDWTLTDRRFFLGLRLAPRTRIAGVLTFPRALSGAHALELHVAPILRDGDAAPGAIDVGAAIPA
jgi:hypothetical protein